MEISDQTATAIDLCRRINRSAAGQYAAHGIEAPDVVIASIYSTHDLATDLHGGDAHGAIEYIRTALDMMERQLLTRAAQAH